MTSPAIERLLKQRGWPLLTADTFAAFADGVGERVLFVTGDPSKNLESDDVAAILPELVAAFGHRFQTAVVDRSLEAEVRQRFDTWPTPSLIFLRDGRCIGTIPKVRDWDDYLLRIAAILNGEVPAGA